MRRLTSLFSVAVLCLPAFAQNKPAKPTPNEKAGELLQAAFDMAPGAQPEVGATALMRIGENYEGLDAKKAREAMQRAFAVSLGIPPSDDAKSQRVQVLVVSAAAQINLEDAIEMIKQVEPVASRYDIRQEPVNRIVTRLIEEKKFDEAIDFVNSVGVIGQYPYAAVEAIFRICRSRIPGVCRSSEPRSPYTRCGRPHRSRTSSWSTGKICRSLRRKLPLRLSSLTL